MTLKAGKGEFPFTVAWPTPFLSLSPNSQPTTEKKVQAPWNWSNPVRGAQDVQLYQDPVHKEEPGSREQDPESQAAAETIKDRQ